MITPSQEFRARRRANRAHIKSIKACPITSQRIDVGRGKILVPAQAEISPALIISEDDDNIRLFSLCEKTNKQRKERGDAFHAQMVAQEQGGVKEKLLVIPQGTGMAGLILKSNHANGHKHRPAISKNHTRAAKVAVEHSFAAGFPVFIIGRFKNERLDTF